MSTPTTSSSSSETILQEYEQSNATLATELASDNVKIGTLENQVALETLAAQQKSTGGLQNQVDAEVLILEAVATALKAPMGVTQADLPTWAAHVMSKLPPHTVL